MHPRSTLGRDEKYIKYFVWKTEGKIILEWILGKGDGKKWTGRILLSIEARGGLL
jgi:hypothetical protein